MLQINKLSLQRGGIYLLDQTDVTIFSKQRVGIIGANGTGKSSFFHLILKRLNPDHGEISYPGTWRIAYMAQETPTTSASALDYVLDGDLQYREIQQSLLRAEKDQQHEQLGRLYEQFDSIQGYSAESRAARLLNGLGFAPEEIQQPVSGFSGGWRIRLNLAQALMCPSDLLLLDEPTNHLDLDAILWLEQWLKQYDGTLLLISHDRDVIDNTCQQILHFEYKKLTLYTGNYSSFERQRALKLAEQQANYEKQQARKKEVEQFIRRFKAKATKAKQAQSRVKMLEKMQDIAPAHIDSPFHFSFQCADKLSSPLLAIKQAEMGYPQSTILKQVDITILPNARIGILGANGAGKSTLVKSLARQIPLVKGQYADSENLQIGYFAQHQVDALDLNASPFLHIQRLSPLATEQSIRNFLGGFNFRDDKSMADVSTFSGGEKARLALAIIVWQKPNLLLLDEPTNHLDMEMRHALEMALQDFSGALLIISHDRHLLKTSADDFWVVHNGTVRLFKGDWDDYLQWLDEQKQNPGNSKQQNKPSSDKKELKRQQAEFRAKLSPYKKKIQQLENRMETLQAQLDKLEEQLSDPTIYEDNSKEKLQRTIREQADIKNQLEQTEEQWMNESAALEELEKKLILIDYE